LQQPQQGLINIDISALKEIYNKAIGSSNGVKTLSNNSTLNFIRTLNVNWDTYTLQKRKDSSIVAEFDMKNDTGLYVLKKLNFGDTIKYKNQTTVTFIKFKDGSRLNFFTKIIEDLTLPGSHSVLNKLHYNQVPYGFTGMILYYTLDRQYINGYRYVNSTIQGTVSLNTTPPITMDKSVNSVKTNEALFCDYSPVYAMVCTSDGGATYSFTCGLTVVGYSGSCTGGGSGGGGSVGGGSGGGGGGYGGDPTPPNPCSPITYSIRPVAIQSVNNGKRVMVAQPDVGGGDGSGGGSSPCASVAQVITNNVNNPCLHDMVKAAINRDIKYNLQKSMVGIFGGDQTTFNLNFIDGPFYNSDGSINITTQGTTHSIARKENFNGRFIITSMNVEIMLNSNTLPNASQEFTSAIILHEALHAYFAETGQIDAHDVMVNHYIPWFEATLQSMYPTISPGDIEALAYSGLTDSQAFGTPPANTSLRDHYNTVQNLYQHGNSGTPCN